MKKIIALLALTLIGCGREADLLKAQKSVFPKSNFSTMSAASNKNFESDMRDMTLLIYPNSEDLEGFTFSPREETGPSWNMVEAKLSSEYRSHITRKFENSDSAGDKVSQLIVWIQTAGGVRDNTFRESLSLKREQKANQDSIEAADNELKPKIADVLSSITCFYQKRARTGQKWDCRTVADADYKREKKPSDCGDLDYFTFVFPDADSETTFETQKASCNSIKAELDARTTDLVVRNQVIRPLIVEKDTIRDAGKTVVLELLESVEKHNRGTFVATNSTLDKALDCPGNATGVKCVSFLKLGNKNTEVLDMAIYSDFGIYSDQKLPTTEYSLKNGRIKNLKLFTNSWGVRKLQFDMLTDLFTISADLSMTVQDDMGLRFVGETRVYLKDSTIVRRGVMKLEFNEKK